MVRDYHGALPDELCDALIKLFDEDVQHHERVDNEARPTFTQLNLNQHHAKIVPTLSEYALDVLKRYKQDIPATEYLPPARFFEEFRIKKYNVGGKDRFDEHVDVSDYASAKRCLSMLFYLNSVPVGGQTVFPQQGLSFRATTGYAIVFPPTWEYQHSGQAPIGNPKYIMSTYLHYG